jgi:hypothetical protein
MSLEEFFKQLHHNPNQALQEAQAGVEYFGTLYEAQKQRWEEFQNMMQVQQRTN